MSIVTSKNNEIVKYAINIKDKKYSRLHGECLVETDKVIADLIANGVQISTILVVEDKQQKFNNILSNFSGKIVVIADTIARAITDSVTPSGIFAFAKIPTVNNAKLGSKVLVLDNLQDPANLGAILRSALAFGFTDILTINCTYPYSYKVIRSSMGYVFKIKMLDVTIEELKDLISAQNIQLICADMSGDDISKFTPNKANIAIVIGNEGKGVSSDVCALCSSTVSIPMKNNVESLNASVSASILMYYLKD